MASHVSYEFIAGELAKLHQRIDSITQSITVSEVTVIPTPTADLSGLSVSVISIGSQFNFFGTGNLDHTQTLNNGTKYYLLTQDVQGYPAQFEALDYYLGDPAVCTLWITSGATGYSLPLFFDRTGIWFRPTSNIANVAEGSTFSFTMLLILAPAE